jgi:uncharacterized delta-60 repeat protein
MRLRYGLLVMAFAVGAVVPPASAAAGDLDPAFSVDGRRTVSFTGGAAGTSVARQGSKMIVAGTAGQPGDTDLALARLTANGHLDGAFGNDGRVRIDVFGRDDTLGEVEVLGNEKIVVVGTAVKGTDRRIVVARLKPDGGFDRSFGGDGIVIVDTTKGVTGVALAPLSGGRVAVGGNVGDIGGTDMLVVRLLSDGRLDRSFSGNGLASVGFSGATHVGVSDLVRWGTGDALLAIGYMGGDVAIVSFAANGTLPDDFGGGDGKTRLDLGPNDYEGSVIPRSLGFFLVTGYTDGGGTGGWDPFVARFNASGNPDDAWGGGDGVVLHDAGTDFEYWFEAVAAGRKVVMAGQVDGDAALFRIRRNGSADGSFGTSGVSVVPFPGGDSIFRSVAPVGDGRLAAVGSAPATLVDDGIAAARLLGS